MSSQPSLDISTGIVAQRDLPTEWIPDSERQEQLARRLEEINAERRRRRIPVTFITQSEYQLQQSLISDRWFLLKNHYSFKSKLTGRKETYYTKAGVERPFNGMQRIYLMFYNGWREAGKDHDAATLLAEANFTEVINLGLAEPITPTRAKKLLVAIKLASGVDLRNARG